MTEQKVPEAPARIKELVHAVADRRLALDEANEAAKAAQTSYDEAEAVAFDAMEDAGLVSVRTDRGLFRLNDLAWASVEDEEQARAWAEAHAPELLTLNRQRLSVIVRKVIKGEEDAPGTTPGQTPPGVTFRTSRKITWRRT